MRTTARTVSVRRVGIAGQLAPGTPSTPSGVRAPARMHSVWPPAATACRRRTFGADSGEGCACLATSILRSRTSVIIGIPTTKEFTLSNTPNDQRPDKMAVLLEVARRANWDAMHGPVHLRSGSPQRPAGLASRMAKRTSRVLASPWQPSSAGEQEAPLVALLVSRPSAHGSSRSRPAWHCSRRVPSVGASAFPRHWRQKLVVGDLTSDRGDVSPTAPG